MTASAFDRPELAQAAARLPSKQQSPHPTHMLNTSADATPPGCLSATIGGSVHFIASLAFGTLVYLAGLALLSYLAGFDLRLLRAWHAGPFSDGFLYAARGLSALVITVLLLGAFRSGDDAERATRWEGLWSGWLLLSIPLIIAGHVVDALGAHASWEPIGISFVWLGWALLFPVWWLWTAVRSALKTTSSDGWDWLVAVGVILLVTTALSPGPRWLRKTPVASWQKWVHRLPQRLRRSERQIATLDQHTGALSDVAEGARAAMLFGHTRQLSLAQARRSLDDRRPEPEGLPPPEASKPQGYVLALTWMPHFCRTRPHLERSARCRNTGFGLHGLWPQSGPGRSIRCKSGPDFSPNQSTVAKRIFSSMTLARHEWDKHGRCLGWTQERYFEVTEQAWNKTIRPHMAPSARRRPRVGSDFLRRHDWTSAGWRGEHKRAVLRCEGGGLAEVWVCFDAALDPAACPRRLRDTCRTRMLRR